MKISRRNSGHTPEWKGPGKLMASCKDCITSDQRLYAVRLGQRVLRCRLGHETVLRFRGGRGY